MKHRCREMIRDEEFRTPEGQAAWSFYQKWMKAHMRGVPNPEAFLTSKFYTAFMKFAHFTKRVKIPDIDAYIWLMSKNDIGPNMWSMDEAYSMYLEFVDRKMKPKDSARITVDALFDLKEEYGCEVGDVFDVVPPSVIIMLLRQRRLTPWILIHSKKFKNFFKNACSSEERMIMESIIRPEYWTEKFQKDAESVKLMKTYVEALSI